MKRNASKIMLFLGIISLVLGTMTSYGMKISYANNLEIIGTDLGLEVKPSGTKLFDLTNLNPGDKKEAKIDIKNNYTLPFEVFMRTERSSPKPIEADLFEQLILTIYLDDIEIYTGPMKDYARSNISLGAFNPNSGKELRALVYLPGAETGNEFQGKHLEVKWYFIAELNDAPDTPTPDRPDKPDRPGSRPRPDRPEEIEIIENEIPLAKPDLIQEEEEEEPEEIEIKQDEIPLGKPEIPKDEETEKSKKIEDKIPLVKEDKPRYEFVESRGYLPRTGELFPMIFYGTGLFFVLAGISLSVKKKK